MRSSAFAALTIGLLYVSHGQAAPEPAAPAPAAPAPVTAPAPAADTTAARSSKPDRTAKNVLFAELGGNALLYSLNYERFFFDDVSLRMGFEYFSVGASAGSVSESASLTMVPIMVDYFGVGGTDHKLELGIGLLPVIFSGAASIGGASATESGVAFGGTATVGYRYVPHDGGFMFKIGFTPVFGLGGFAPWGGLGLGVVF